MEHSTTRPGRRPVRAGLVLAASLTAISVGVATADSAMVTSGDFHAFATGIGREISGHAHMVRTADEQTIVTVHVVGLDPNTTYAAHVHQQPCAVGDADGHFRFDPAGAAAPPNEIWPGFTTNAAGIGNGRAKVDGRAGSNAVSVVVHAPGGAKIACADLN
jgi:hypothetical protein